ncbi:hypothetical protein [Haloactinopolyspora sp.]|uniref:maleate cis-trans isomerase family protein n=1 Tax=Haloactinopolyspora sp. TaxID=1966353 RepID=UPI002611BC53|nr:hypothetical protein [Haloactinopolyspora sp.]
MTIPEGYAGPPGPPAQFGVGVIAPYDFVLDRELWRWVPSQVSLRITRTPFVDGPVSVEQADQVSGDAEIVAAARSLMASEPQVIAYACTSGSFVHGIDGELHLRETIRAAAGAAAVTTSGALLAALEALGVQRIGIATPYVREVTDALLGFLDAAGVQTVATEQLGLQGRIWTVPYSTTYRLIKDADRPEAEAIFVSCTNLPTYDLIASLEQELGKPVLTANQVTAWGALRDIGLAAVGPGQAVLDTV